MLTSNPQVAVTSTT